MSLLKSQGIFPSLHSCMAHSLRCLLWLFFVVCSLEAGITRFEFIEEPNDGESLITDGNDNPGPTILSSFTYTVESTPADIRIHNQFETAPIFAADDVIIADFDEGIETGQDINLLEGMTWIYLFARNPTGNAGGAVWELGPLSFEGGGELVFRVDQGPPRAPAIGNFDIEGGRTANLPDPAHRAFFVNSSPSNPEVTMEVFFNRFDVNNSGPTMEITFDGSVQNDPSLFDADPDSPPNPNPVTPNSRPESNALVAAQLGRILSGIPDTGPPLLVEFVGDTTAFTGPGPLSVALIDRSAGLSNPDITPARTGEALGAFERIGFDFKTLPDGDYEIIVGAQDAAHGDSQNGRSPGAFNAFGTLEDPVPGIPSRVIIRKDTLQPQAAIINAPESVFLFGNTPPAVDPPFEDSIFSIQGTVSNERQEPTKVHIFSQDSPDLDADPSGGPYNNRVVLSDPASGQFVEQVNATNFEPPLTIPPYTPAAQSAYRFLFVPEDQQGNANTDDPTELFLIKDYAPPSTPSFTNVSDGDAILTEFFRIQAEASNDPTLITAEHGLMNYQLEIFRQTSAGSEGVQTFVLPASTANQNPSTISVLDNAFVSTSLTFPITDPNGVPTGQIATVSFADQTERFSGLVFESFTMDRNVNFTNVQDGILNLRACLIDQVGNVSNPCTSVTVLKDLTGPQIGLNLSESGPDDNYTTGFPTIPNFEGADDNRFVISLKSPENTVDPTSVTTRDPFFEIPGFPNDVDAISLRLRGSSNEAFGVTTRIIVEGNRIPDIELRDAVTAPGGTNVSVDYEGQVFQVSQPSFARTSVTQFEARVPVFNLLEGVPETLRLRAFDNLGNGGDFQDIVVIRDTNPPPPVTLQAPPEPSDGSTPVLYANQNSILLQGLAEPAARLVLMTPPTGAAAGFEIPSTSRIARTTPGAIPIAGSQFDTLATACASLTCQFFEADASGLFRVEAADISTVATSLSTATTVWIQTIDRFDNTDPVSSARPIEIRKSDLEIPLDKLFVLDYPPGTSNRVQIFPDSALNSPWTTVFFNQDLVKLEMQSFFPMQSAPDLFITQPDFVKKAAGKLPSVFPSDVGTFSFRYAYEVEPRVADFDGLSDFEVSGGEDFFGNPVATTRGPALIVDTVAPSELASPPQVIASPFDSVRAQSFTSVRVDAEDWFRDQLVTTQTSGVATDQFEIRLFGPLQGNTDSVTEVDMTTFLPSEPDFDLAARPTQPLETDGTYRIEFQSQDQLGNSARFRKTFVLDSEEVVEPLILSDPADGSRVSTFVQVLPGGSAVRMTIRDIDSDLNASDFAIFGPDGSLLESIKTVEPGTSSVLRTFTPTSHPATDGSSDGIYRLDLSAVDKTGNTTVKEHSFVYDTLAPEVDLFFPPDQACLSDLQLAQASVSDSAAATSDFAGLNQEVSHLSLQLNQPMHPANPLNPGDPMSVRYRSLSQGASDSLSLIGLFEPGVDVNSPGFPRDHSRDGEWAFEVGFQDLASNQSSDRVTFRIDSEFPSLSVSDLKDGGFLTSQAFELGGVIQDRGCGFELDSSGEIVKSGLALKVFEWDPDQESQGNLLFQTEASQLWPSPLPDFPAESMQARYLVTGVLPVPAAPPGQTPQVLLRFELQDAAGNVTYNDRKAKLRLGGIQGPRRLSPLSQTKFRGQSLQTYTTSPVLELEWEPVAEAVAYRLHLSRQSLTPGIRTTSLLLEGGVLSHSVDYSLLSSASGGSLLPPTDDLYWFVEALDQLDQGSDPLGILGRGEKIRYDSAASALSVSMIDIADGGEFKDPSADLAFISTSPAEFRLTLPEPARIRGTELIRVEWPNGKQSFQSSLQLPIETDQFLLSVDIPARTPNGEAELLLDGWKDAAGNPFSDLRVRFKLDLGPKLVAEVFQSPVDALDYRFVIKGLDWNGEDDFLVYDASEPTPRVTYTQAQSALEPDPLIPIGSLDFGNGLVGIRGFTSGFRLNPDYRGDIRLGVHARDIRGHEAFEEIFLHLKVPARHESVLKVEGLRSQSRYEAPVSQTSGLKVLDLQDFAYVHQGDGLAKELKRGSTPYTGACTALVFVDYGAQKPVIPAQKVQCSKDRIDYQIYHHQLNSLMLVRDTEPPSIKTPEWEVEVEPDTSLFQFEAFDQQTVLTSAMVLAGPDQHPAKWVLKDRFEVDLQLDPGHHDLQIVAQDAAGNEARVQRSVQVMRPFGLDRFDVYPNPMRKRAFIEVRFSRPPESGVLQLYDAAGARMKRLNLPLHAVFKEPMDLLLPPHAANGVYFLKLTGRHGERKIREIRKFAVLR